MTYVGVGSIAVSIPVLSGRKQRYSKAAEIYNSDYKNGKLGALQSNMELHLVSNKNGMGLQLKF